MTLLFCSGISQPDELVTGFPALVESFNFGSRVRLLLVAETDQLGSVERRQLFSLEQSARFKLFEETLNRAVKSDIIRSPGGVRKALKHSSRFRKEDAGGGHIDKVKFRQTPEQCGIPIEKRFERIHACKAWVYEAK